MARQRDNLTGLFYFYVLWWHQWHSSFSHIIYFRAPDPQTQDAGIPVEKLPRWVKRLWSVFGAPVWKKKKRKKISTSQNLSSLGEMPLKTCQCRNQPWPMRSRVKGQRVNQTRLKRSSLSLSPLCCGGIIWGLERFKSCCVVDIPPACVEHSGWHPGPNWSGSLSYCPPPLLLLVSVTNPGLWRP